LGSRKALGKWTISRGGGGVGRKTARFKTEAWHMPLPIQKRRSLEHMGGVLRRVTFGQKLFRGRGGKRYRE